jgi:hypothetical protein
MERLSRSVLNPSLDKSMAQMVWRFLKEPSDHGMLPLTKMLIVTDCKPITDPSKVLTFHFALLEFEFLPLPPAWLKFMPNRTPYPNIFIEVAVNDQLPKS